MKPAQEIKRKKKKKRKSKRQRPNQKKKKRKKNKRRRRIRKRQCTESTDQTKKRKRKRATNWISSCPNAHGHFHHLSIKFLPLNFLSILERTFWQAWGENTRALPIFFSPLPPTKHPPKKFYFPFSLQNFSFTLFHL